MPIYDFIVQKIFPLFGSSIPADCLNWFDALYWTAVGCVCIYWAIYVPYYCIRKLSRLPAFFGKGK